MLRNYSSRSSLTDRRSLHNVNGKYVHSIEEKSPGPVSQQTFFLGSLGIFSLGLLAGVKIIMKREKYKLPPGDRTAAIGMATKALALGTVLCVGTFLGAGTIFMGVTGISTVKQFGEFAQRIVDGTGLSEFKTKIDPEQEKESIEIEQDLEKAMNELFNPSDNVQDSNSTKMDQQLKSTSTENSNGSVIETIRNKLRSKFKNSEKTTPENNSQNSEETR